MARFLGEIPEKANQKPRAALLARRIYWFQWGRCSMRCSGRDRKPEAGSVQIRLFSRRRAHREAIVRRRPVSAGLHLLCARFTRPEPQGSRQQMTWRSHMPLLDRPNRSRSRRNFRTSNSLSHAHILRWRNPPKAAIGAREREWRNIEVNRTAFVRGAKLCLPAAASCRVVCRRVAYRGRRRFGHDAPFTGEDRPSHTPRRLAHIS